MAAGEAMLPAETMDSFREAMYMTKPDFEENKISEYRMSYNEMLIALAIAQCLSNGGEHDRAAYMVQSMLNSRENARASEEDKAILFPTLHYTLSNILNNAGRYKEALKACENAIEVCREYNNLRRMPEMLFCLAYCYHKLGEEEHIYKTHLLRAYHTAYAIGNNETALTIKKDALKYYGITLP
jgi:tetratricopeptide (TPR) repeat protein